MDTLQNVDTIALIDDNHGEEATLYIEQRIVIRYTTNAKGGYIENLMKDDSNPQDDADEHLQHLQQNGCAVRLFTYTPSEYDLTSDTP